MNNIFSPDADQGQKTSAKYMHRSLILRVALCYGSFILGTMAEYEQSLMLFLVFTVINGITGGVIFFAHCFSNEVVSTSTMKALLTILYRQQNRFIDK